MIELLSAAMFGTDLAVDQPAGTEFDLHNRGLFVLAIDAGRLESTGNAAAEHGEHLLTALLDGENARLPGDRRRAHRRRVTEEGLEIEVPAALHATILELVSQFDGKAASGANL
jgi:LDH2 family malate/lactate/ureidoglycolate dehydrogenase